MSGSHSSHAKLAFHLYVLAFLAFGATACITTTPAQDAAPKTTTAASKTAVAPAAAPATAPSAPNAAPADATAQPAATGDPAPEFRSLWVTRMAWSSRDGNPDTIKEKIRAIFSGMKEDGFNAVLFQIRGEAETLYPSPLEPWSRLLGGKDPGFDPLEFAIAEAHKNGLEFHAYMNPFPLFGGRAGSKPENLDHPFYKYGPGTDNCWVALGDNGEPMVADYYYFDPGIPQVHEYVRKVILDVVRRYDVDGIHLDRIRYPGHAESNPISAARFQGRGNPTRQERGDWHRAQIDKFVNDLYAEVVAEKPNVVLSAAAWGIYNKYNLEGYYGFSSGYHDYYQDTLEWIRLGAMDYLVPMIYWDMKDPKPNYQELIDDFADKSDIARIVGGMRRFGPEEITAQIEYTRKAGAPGTAIFSSKRYPELREGIYSKPAPLPKRPWKTNPDTGIILGTVTDETGAPLVDAWVSLSPAGDQRSQSPVFRQTWTSSADGRVAFLKVPPGEVEITVNYVGAPKPLVQTVKVEAGNVTKTTLKLESTKEAKAAPFFEIANPKDGERTSREVVHLLGRTLPTSTISINGEPVEVLRTGAFAKDNIALQPGDNRLVVEVRDAAGHSATRTVTVTRGDEPEADESAARSPRRRGQETDEPASKLKIASPADDLALRPGDLLNIELTGPPNMKGTASLGDAFDVNLTEKTGDDGAGSGVYLASVRIPPTMVCPPTALRFRLVGDAAESQISEESKARVEVWDARSLQVGETKGPISSFVYGLHDVRLGGPNLADVPEGTRFEIIGKQGRNYKARLTPTLSGWTSEENVNLLPAGTPPPHLFFTSFSVNGTDAGDDVVTIPYGQKVVYSLSAEVEPTNVIYLDLYNTHLAMTWGSHKATAQNVGHVRCEQRTDDWVRVIIPVKSKQNWGFWAEVAEGYLRIHVRRPPVLAATPERPFQGLTFAVEAGHGSARNIGARGYMGSTENIVNALAARTLQKELESRGGVVVQMRPGYTNPNFLQRLQYAYDADADILISLHCNAGGGNAGYLREMGTSTYYKYENSALLAGILQEEMLSLGWGDFGCVGNFNYSPLRSTRMPAVLVEQAFINMPKEEARLSDPEYQKDQAKVIADGVERFLKQSGVVADANTADSPAISPATAGRNGQ